MPKLITSRLIDLIYLLAIRCVVDERHSRTLGSHGDVRLGNSDAVPVAAVA